MNYIMYIPHVLIVEFDKFNELYGISSYKEIKNKIFELLKYSRKKITLKHREGNVADEIGYSFYVDFKNVSNLSIVLSSIPIEGGVDVAKAGVIIKLNDIKPFNASFTIFFI